MTTKTITMLAALVAVIATAIAIAVGGADGASPQTSRAPHALTCPAHYHRPAFTDYAALYRLMVPRRPSQFIVCRYAGLNAKDPQALTGYGLGDKGSKHIRRVVRIYNALPAPPQGPVSCPADLGREITVQFRYGKRPDDSVQQDMTGCRTGTNGHRTVDTFSKRGERLLRLLLRTLSGA